MTEFRERTLELPPLCLPSMLGRDIPRSSTDPADVVRLVASGICNSKTSLARETRGARSAVTSTVDLLVRRQILRVSGWVATETGRGRPAERLVINPDLGLVGIIDGGATHAQISIATMDQRVLGVRQIRWDVKQGPDLTLERYADEMTRMIRELAPRTPLLSVVIGLPARVDHDAQRPVRPTIMPRWDGYPVCERLADLLGCPAYLENDVNLRGLGEAAGAPRDWLPILAIKVGTGIGGGLIDSYGRVFHGHRGAAGEIGHIPVEDADPGKVCLCGARGCLEANASIKTMIDRLRQLPGAPYQDDVNDIDILLEELRRGDPETVRVARESAEMLGDVVAILCNVLNPRRVVIGCPISAISDDFLAGVRSRAYEKARPLATRELVIAYSMFGDAAGVVGALALGIDMAIEHLVR